MMKTLLIALLLCISACQMSGQKTDESMQAEFPAIEANVKVLYANLVFGTATNPGFKISDICTDGFLSRLSEANDYDTEGYATWLLRSGMQDGDDTPSEVLSVTPGEGNTVVVRWSDMGHQGSTTLTMTRADGMWKIDGATVPEGYKPL
ncbi:MAG: hypothetical protein K2H87_06670 [Duncaniella sp.]|nr:hypothetical protein [Duncaniella sp.]